MIRQSPTFAPCGVLLPLNIPYIKETALNQAFLYSFESFLFWLLIFVSSYSSFALGSKLFILETLIIPLQPYNPSKNIRKKIEKFSKTGQGKKSLIPTFACFLTATAEV